MVTRKRVTKQKLVTVVTPIGYLTTTPAIAARVKKAQGAPTRRVAKPRKKRK